MDRKVLAERIRHERELREAEAAAFAHERELRAVYDQHERDLRLQVEEAVAKQHDAEQVELRRRLDDLNHARERADEREAHAVSREIYDAQIGTLETQVDRLVTQLGVWRGIIIFLGLPGVVALIWTLLAAFSGHTVTGPGGFIPT